MKTISEKVIVADLKNRQKNITVNDIKEIVADTGKQKNASAKARKINLVDEVKLCWDFIRDSISGCYPDYSLSSVLLIGAALTYLISPLDVIPDFVPLGGLLDDATAITIVIKLLYMELSKYKEWRKNSPKGALTGL